MSSCIWLLRLTDIPSTGLLTALQLQSFGITTLVIEATPKSAQDTYGRAITLYPRTSELLDQLSLADVLAQECFACRETVSYDAEGREVMGRGWSFMESMSGDDPDEIGGMSQKNGHTRDIQGKTGKAGPWTQWGFALVLRQKYQEEIFRRRLKELGGTLVTEAESFGIEVLNDVQYKVSVRVRDIKTGMEHMVRCKYLVGADGGSSFVRRALNIPFDGEKTMDQWVRIDGIVETNMPRTRVYGALESPTHGNVLWAALDRGATRIGFAYTAERQKAYPVFTQEAAVSEAIAAVKPFELKFNEVHWYTVYTVGQKIARHFYIKDACFLAGDAAHTHSSGAAQGMNTGIHDAVNLSWKLALVLRGTAEAEILYTYESERLPNVQKLINYDKDISRLMTMQLPQGWTGDPAADPNEILGHVMADAASFTSGLSIGYDCNALNVNYSNASSVLLPGQRAPDAILVKPGTFESTRIHSQLPNIAVFHVIVFVGLTKHTSAEFSVLAKAHSEVTLPGSSVISWLTIIGEAGPSAYEMLGNIMPLGKVFYDPNHLAHRRYGIDITKGGLCVVRPDGWIGTILGLDQRAMSRLGEYFGRFLN